MNMRNLFLLSIIVCSAPVVCAPSTVSLTKQEREVGLTKSEQEALNEWIRVVKTLPAEAQHIIKVTLRVMQDVALYALDKMYVGKNISDHRREMNEIGEKKFRLVFEEEVGGYTKQCQLTMPSEKFEQIMVQAFKLFSESPLNMFFEGTKINDLITEEDMVMMQKWVAMYELVQKLL